MNFDTDSEPKPIHCRPTRSRTI